MRLDETASAASRMVAPYNQFQIVESYRSSTTATPEAKSFGTLFCWIEQVSKSMKIEFSRSGGFAAPAMKRSVRIDTDDLPQDEAVELLSLIKEADLARLSSQPPTAAQPDAFHYKITVSDKGVSQTAGTSDADMPETVQPLVDWLEKRATEKG